LGLFNLSEKKEEAMEGVGGRRCWEEDEAMREKAAE